MTTVPMLSRRQKIQGRKETGTFLPVPTNVLASPNFCGLSLKAKAMILDLGARFNGFNNGNLAAPWSEMRKRGWRSKDTLYKALRELRNAGMIELTKQGGLYGPSLYAFTWRAIDACKANSDMAATNVASGKWQQLTIQAKVIEKLHSPPRLSGRAAPVIGQNMQKSVAK